MIQKSEYPSYYDTYIQLASDIDLAAAFKNQNKKIAGFFEAIDEKDTLKGYHAGKWSLKEMLQHIIDTERIFCYRALAIARGENQSLPGFNENEYARSSHANQRAWESLCKEFHLVRKGTEMMFDHFNEADLLREGISNQHSITVRAIGYIIIGHLYHHIEVIKERYLNGQPNK